MNEEEILRKNIVLLSHGKLPCDISTCEIYGISGNCGEKCPNFKNKTCEVYDDVLEGLYKQVQNNWNELKKSVEERMKELNPEGLEIGRFNIKKDDYTMGQYGVYQSTLKKMQELEQGKDENAEN